MTYIEKLRARLKEAGDLVDTKAARIEQLVATPEADFTETVLAEIKTVTAEKKAANAAVSEIEMQIKDFEAALAVKATYAVPADRSTTIPAQAKAADFTPQQQIGLLIKGMMTAFNMDGTKGLRPALKALEDEGLGAIAQRFSKSLNSGAGSAGGFLVPEDFNDTVIEMLTPYSGFLRGGPQTIPLPNGNYRQAAEASRPTVGYRAEGGDITVSQPTFRDFTMSAKLLSGTVPVTNQLIRFTAGKAANVASMSLSTNMGLAMDAAAFVGTGALNTPTGIFNIVGITSFVATNSTTPTAAQIDMDARKLLNVAASYAQLSLGLVWVMPQRVKGYLEDLKNAQGALEYPGLSQVKPMFKGYPVIVTASIPTNGGTGTNEATIGLVSFGTILFGEGKGLELAISSDATVGGVSMFATDQTAIRATMEHDFQAVYAESVGKLTAVKWGA